MKIIRWSDLSRIILLRTLNLGLMVFLSFIENVEELDPSVLLSLTKYHNYEHLY